MDQNNCSFIGRVVADPIFTPGKSDARHNMLFFRIAVNRIKSDHADMIPVKLWGKLADAGVAVNPKTGDTNINTGKELSITGEYTSNSVQDSAGKYTNYHCFTAHRVSYGRDSLKKQQKAAANTAVSTSSEEQLAEKLAKAAGVPVKPKVDKAKLKSIMMAQYDLSEEQAEEIIKNSFPQDSTPVQESNVPPVQETEVPLVQNNTDEMVVDADCPF